MEAAEVPPAVVIYDRNATDSPVVDLRINECMQWAEQHGITVLAVCIDVRPAALDDGQAGICLMRPELARAVALLHQHPEAFLLAFCEERISTYAQYLDEVVRTLDSRVLVGRGRRLAPNPWYGDPPHFTGSSVGARREGMTP